MNKLLACTLLVVLLCIGVAGISQAYAIDFSFCYNDPNHHCMIYNPQLNQLPTTGKPNWHVEINLPETNSSVIDTILSNDNFTALKNDIAVMAVENIFTTTASPTSNFCPVSLQTLVNQGVPEYLDKFYNKISSLDLTDFIYPTYCYTETGANPVSGKGPTTVPEFPWVTMILVLIFSGVVLLGRLVDGRWAWQFGKLK